MAARVVGIVGAECSGKSALAGSLSAALPRSVVVPEQLRGWVLEHGRAPSRSEQPAMMAAQVRAEQEAAAGHDWVVSDSGTLMTAVYSELYFGDASLVAAALTHHRSYELTVWCGIEIPWAADPGQRDGPGFRSRGHEILARALAGSGLPVLPVAGPLPERVAQVLAVLYGVEAPSGAAIGRASGSAAAGGPTVGG